MRPGDIITKLAHKNVLDTESFATIADSLEPGRTVAVLVVRGRQSHFLAMRVPG